jgi:hypothetical protein
MIKINFGQNLSQNQSGGQNLSQNPWAKSKIL